MNKSSRSRSTVRILVITLLLATGCVGNPYWTATPLPSEALWANPCELPCWNHITPGESTYESTIDRLTGLHFVNASSLVRDREYDRVYWETVPQYRGKGGVDFDSDIAARVWIRGNFNVKLGEVVSRMGPPDFYARTTVGGGSYWEYLLFYRDRGVMYEALGEVSPSQNADPVHADVEVVGFALSYPGDDDEFAQRVSGRSFGPQDLKQWIGFAPISATVPSN